MYNGLPQVYCIKPEGRIHKCIYIVPKISLYTHFKNDFMYMQKLSLSEGLAYNSSLPTGLFFMTFCCLLFLFKITFQKILSEIPSECQTVLIQISPDVLLGLIWDQTVCKSYQQMTLVSKEIMYGRGSWFINQERLIFRLS